jgi:Delta-aminolevulinic acid dehydratase
MMNALKQLNLTHRLRRLRQTRAIRELVAETVLRKEDFVFPIFIREGENIAEEIPSMPNIFRFSIDNALRECEELLKLGMSPWMYSAFLLKKAMMHVRLTTTMASCSERCVLSKKNFQNFA